MAIRRRGDDGAVDVRAGEQLRHVVVDVDAETVARLGSRLDDGNHVRARNVREHAQVRPAHAAGADNRQP